MNNKDEYSFLTKKEYDTLQQKLTEACEKKGAKLTLSEYAIILDHLIVQRAYDETIPPLLSILPLEQNLMEKETLKKYVDRYERVFPLFEDLSLSIMNKGEKSTRYNLINLSFLYIILEDNIRKLLLKIQENIKDENELTFEFVSLVANLDNLFFKEKKDLLSFAHNTYGDGIYNISYIKKIAGAGVDVRKFNWNQTFNIFLHDIEDIREEYSSVQSALICFFKDSVVMLRTAATDIFTEANRQSH